MASWSPHRPPRLSSNGLVRRLLSLTPVLKPVRASLSEILGTRGLRDRARWAEILCAARPSCCSMWTARRVLPLPFAPQNVMVLPRETRNRMSPSAPGIENSVGILVRALDIQEL